MRYLIDFFYFSILIVSVFLMAYSSQIIDINYNKVHFFSILAYIVSVYLIFNIYERTKRMRESSLNIEIENQMDEKVKELESKNHQLTEKNKKLQYTSEVDRLTGLYNRVKIEETFEYEKNQANRYKTDLAIVMMDIDFFKDLNDNYGHNEGDKFLVSMAQELMNTFRTTDVVGRWGGEEFLILLPKTVLDDAYTLVERLRKQIEQKDFFKIGKKTASFGVTIFHENDSLNEAVNRADEALYYAKEHGRNQVKISS